MSSKEKEMQDIMDEVAELASNKRKIDASLHQLQEEVQKKRKELDEVYIPDAW